MKPLDTEHSELLRSSAAGSAAIGSLEFPGRRVRNVEAGRTGCHCYRTSGASSRWGKRSGEAGRKVEIRAARSITLIFARR